MTAQPRDDMTKLTQHGSAPRRAAQRRPSAMQRRECGGMAARAAAARAGAGLDRGEERRAAGRGRASCARRPPPSSRPTRATWPPPREARAPGGLPRPPDARCQAHRGDGQGAGGDRRACPIPSAASIARVDAAQRPRDRARARAAGRHRHHLREPAQRDGRRRRAVPQGRQRGDPARRLGQPPLEPRHPGLPGPRPARGGPARGRRSSSCPPPTARRSG